MATVIFYVIALVCFVILLRPLHPARIVLVLFFAFTALSIANANGQVRGTQDCERATKSRLDWCEERIKKCNEP
jgi:hypothetical protein